MIKMLAVRATLTAAIAVLGCLLLPAALHVGSSTDGTNRSASMATATANDVGGCIGNIQEAGRARAWCLLKSLVQSDAGPIWGSWSPDPSKGMDTFCSEDRSAKASSPKLQEKFALLESLTRPGQLPKVIEPATGSQIDQTAAVLFNSAARDSICGQLKGASLTASLNSQAAAGKSFQLDASKYPIAIKTIWTAIPEQDGLVPIWDSIVTPATSQGAPNNWKTLAIVDAPASPSNSISDQSCHFKPPSAPSGNTIVPHVSLNCFYAIHVTQQDIDEAQSVAHIQPRVDVGSAPYYLVLLGFHVAAKGPQGWTWQTFWWSARAFDQTSDESALQRDNPFVGTALADPWSHYAMKTSVIGSAPCGLSNPYLEFKLPGGSQSSCVNCHSLAAYHPGTGGQADAAFQAAQTVGLACQSTASGLRNKQKPSPGAISTDLLWTLADSNDPVPHSSDGAANSPR